jgi:hypothetical protein
MRSQHQPAITAWGVYHGCVGTLAAGPRCPGRRVIGGALGFHAGLLQNLAR